MFLGGLLGLGVISGLANLLYKVFLGIAVYKDATEKNDRNAVLWTILVIIFGVLPALIYVFLRVREENKMIFCPYCGKLISKKYPVCMHCKQPIQDYIKKPLISEDVKKYLIISAVFFVINVVVSVFNTFITVGANQNIHYHLF